MTKQIGSIDIQSVFHEEEIDHGIQTFVDDIFQCIISSQVTICILLSCVI
jgi:hypothetical protein